MIGAAVSSPVQPGLAQPDIVRIALGIDRVHHGAGISRQVVQGVSGMAGFASGLIQPGIAVLVTHRQHPAVAVLTDDTGIAHGAPQTLGHLTWMALVTGLFQAAVSREQQFIGAGSSADHDDSCITLDIMSDCRSAPLQARYSGQIQRRRVVAAGAEHRGLIAADQCHARNRASARMLCFAACRILLASLAVGKNEINRTVNRRSHFT